MKGWQLLLGFAISISELGTLITELGSDLESPATKHLRQAHYKPTSPPTETTANLVNP